MDSSASSSYLGLILRGSDSAQRLVRFFGRDVKNVDTFKNQKAGHLIVRLINSEAPNLFFDALANIIGSAMNSVRAASFVQAAMVQESASLGASGAEQCRKSMRRLLSSGRSGSRTSDETIQALEAIAEEALSRGFGRPSVAHVWPHHTAAECAAEAVFLIQDALDEVSLGSPLVELWFV